MAIFQDLVDQHGFTGQYNSVKRFCAKLRHKEPEQFDRLSFLPGEEMQVDYGEGAPTRVPGSERYRKPRLFVATLRYSRASFRCVVWKSSQQIWAELHEQALRYFGGCPQYVVLDNLKEGVFKPDLYEPELNKVYAATLAHYGVVADPARVRDPNRKGTVEHAIGHTQATALKGRRFESIEAQNEFLAHWEKSWAAKRIHGTERRQVQAMFEEERAHLKPLPLLGMQYFEEAVRAAPSSSHPTAWCRTGANIWATPPWPPPSWTASCTAAQCWSSRARATASRRLPHASPSHPSRHNLVVLPGGIWGGQGWGNLTWPSGVGAARSSWSSFAVRLHNPLSQDGLHAARQACITGRAFMTGLHIDGVEVGLACHRLGATQGLGGGHRPSIRCKFASNTDCLPCSCLHARRTLGLACTRIAPPRASYKRSMTGLHGDSAPRPTTEVCLKSGHCKRMGP